MRKKILASIIAATAAGGIWFGCTSVERSHVAPVAVVQEEKFPLPVIELRGTPAEIGAEHGKQLDQPIHTLVENYLRPFFKSDFQRFVALTTASGFEPKLLPRHLDEAKALATATQLDEREVMLAQCFLDLSKLMGCSTIALPADASPDHVGRLGRNLDFPSLDVADKYSVVFVVHPQGKNAFAAVGWPGMMGVLSGMNEHGLTLCNMEVSRSPRFPSGMPYTLLYRTILEDCKTVDEAIDLLNKTPRQTANNIMLMDAAGNRAAVEITPEKVTVRRGVDHAAVISTNHQRGGDMDTAGRCWRYDLLHDESKAEYRHIDLNHLEQLLAQVQQGNMTLQSMVFEPTTRVLYLATGQRAADKHFYRLDLKKYF